MPEENNESFANRPIATFKPGHGVSVTNWRNRGPDGDFITTNVEKSWKDGEDWKSRKISLTFDELAHLLLTLQSAYTAQLLERSQQQGRARAA